MVTNHVYDKEHNTTEINIDLTATKLPANSSCVHQYMFVCLQDIQQEHEANHYINKQYNQLK